MTHPPVFVQPLCEPHRHDLLTIKLGLSAEAPGWMVIELTANILLFRGIVQDEKVVARSEREAKNLTLVLAEIGCPACWDSSLYDRVIRLLQGFDITTCAKFARGESKNADSYLDGKCEFSALREDTQ